MANILVSTGAELTIALTSTAVAGDTITVTPGANLGTGAWLSYGNLSFSPRVTITTDTSNPATVVGLEFFNCSGIDVNGLHIIGDLSVQTGASAGAFVGAAVGAQLYLLNCNSMNFNNMTIEGDGDVSTANAITYANIRLWDCANLRFEGNNLFHSRYCFLPARSSNLFFIGNFCHDWTRGDAIQMQSIDTFEISENYVCGAFRPSYEDPVFGVHMDTLQCSAPGLPNNRNITLHRNYFVPHTERVDPQFGATTPHNSWTQACLAAKGGGTVSVEDNVIIATHVNSLLTSDFGPGTIGNNTILYYAGGDQPSNARTAAINSNAAATVTKNISHDYVGGSLVDNLTLPQPAGAAQGFPNIRHDGTETFDDFRADDSTGLITSGHGSIYTRGIADPSGFHYPKGYRVAQASGDAAGGGGTPPLVVPTLSEITMIANAG